MGLRALVTLKSIRRIDSHRVLTGVRAASGLFFSRGKPESYSCFDGNGGVNGFQDSSWNSTGHQGDAVLNSQASRNR